MVKSTNEFVVIIKKYFYRIYVIYSQSDVHTVKSTNECVVIMYNEN
jgi:hypothetical protein